MRTKPKELMSMYKKIVKAALNSKVSVNVEMRVSASQKESLSCSVVFFKDDDSNENFTMDLYTFYRKERNKIVAKTAKKLMKSGEHEAAKQEFFAYAWGKIENENNQI